LRDDLEPELALLVAVWQDGTREWLDEIGEVPDEAVSFTLGPNSPSIGSLMLHMIDADEAWIRETMLGMPRQPSEAAQAAEGIDVNERVFPAPPDWSFKRYVQLLHETREQLILLLEGKRAVDIVTSPRGNLLSVRWIIGHLIQHDAYHGGQCVLLMEEYRRTHADT
jgi:uncharacterized damage-inducible protein DinB